MINKGLFTSSKTSYSTPIDLYNELDCEFNFNDDPCPISEPSPFYKDDGLSRNWGSRVFINPPYGKEITKWMYRAWQESLNNKTIVCLVPSRTDTKWWHNYCMKADEIRFIKGRLKFNGENSAPFPSALIIWKSPLGM